MIGKLIHIDENSDVESVDDRVKLIPEFAKLLRKERGPKLMLYVYSVCDYYSPYSRIRTLIARFQVAKTDIFGSKFDPMDDDVKDAISKYAELQILPLFEQHNVQSRKINEMTKAIDEIPIKETLTDDDGNETVVDHLDEIMTKNDKLNKFSLSLQKIEEHIEKHILKVGSESPIVKSLSIIEQRLKKKQLKELGIKT